LPAARDWISSSSPISRTALRATASSTFALDNDRFTGLGNDEGALDASAFRVGASAGDADDRLVYNFQTGALFYDEDGTGTEAAIKIALLDPHLALNASDFVVI
jgi:Ca2+-binding RTX toxin-like protein